MGGPYFWFGQACAVYRITLRFDDGHETDVDGQPLDLTKACQTALALADQAGLSKGDGHRQPKWVRVYHGDHLEIAISVIAGGLFTREVG